MHKNIILVKAPGKLIPNALLEKAFEGHNAFGIAVAASGKILIDREGEHSPVEDFFDVQEKLKDKGLVLCLGTYPEGYHQDNIQPFEIIRAASSGDPELVAFLSGDFSNFTEPEVVHTDEWLATQKYILPYLNKAFKGEDENWMNFLQELDGPLVKTALQQSSVNEGNIVLLTHQGKICIYSRSELATEFDFGWASDPLGYSEGEYPAKEELKTLKARFGNILGLKSKPPVKEVVKPKPSELPVNPPKDLVAEKKTEVKASENKPEGKYVEVPLVVEIPMSIRANKKQVKKYYRNNAGFLPDNWEEFPTVKSNKRYSRVFKTLEELQGQMAESTAVQAPPAVKAKEPVTFKPRETPVDQELLKKPTKAEASILPFIPADQKEALVNDMKAGELRKIIDSNKSEIFDPKSIQEFEKRYPTFEQVAGLATLADIFRWPVEAFVYIQEKHPKAFLVLSLNLRAAYLNSLKLEDLVGADNKKPEAKPASVPNVRPSSSRRNVG